MSGKNANVNMMMCSAYNSDDLGTFFRLFEKNMVNYDKMLFKIKVIAGDYYYERMSIEECKQKAFCAINESNKLTCQQEIDDYIRDNINEKLPLDGPLYRVYVQTVDTKG